MKKKRKANKLLTIIYILVTILVILLIVDFKAWKYLEKKEVKVIDIQDKCTPFLNNLIHTIKDESICENSCRAECVMRDMNFYKSEFVLNLETCNSCKCYCK